MDHAWSLRCGLLVRSLLSWCTGIGNIACRLPVDTLRIVDQDISAARRIDNRGIADVCSAARRAAPAVFVGNARSGGYAKLDQATNDVAAEQFEHLLTFGLGIAFGEDGDDAAAILAAIV